MQKSHSLKQKTVKKRESSHSNIRLINIPLELVTEILSRLPFKTLQRIKCVCKTWYRLLTKDSYFAKLHCKHVMVGMARQYDSDFFTGWDVFDQSHLPANDDIYKCFYWNHNSFLNFVRVLNASGFPQCPTYMLHGGVVSFCKGRYVIDEYERYKITITEYSWFNSFSRFPSREALVIAPTRKSCLQIKRYMQRTASYYNGEVYLCVDEKTANGEVYLCVDEKTANEDHLNHLSGNDILIGTPRYVFDILKKQKSLYFSKTLVLFEADTIFSRGFKDEIYGILKLLPSNVTVRVISATIPVEALEIPRRFWNKRKEEWTWQTQLSKALSDLQRSQLIVEKPPSNALDELKKILQVKRIRKVKCDKEMASTAAFGKFKNNERREKRSTISWNPHLKMNM